MVINGTGNEYDVCVVIVNYNTKNLARDCILSIPDWCQIVIVDNNSSDGSVVIFDELKDGAGHRIVVIKNNENLGFSRANNIGFIHARARYVFLLNSDTLLRSNEIDVLLKWMDSHPDIGACGPKLVYTDGTPQPSPSPVPTTWMYVVRFLGLKHLLPWKGVRQFFLKRFRPILGKVLVSHMDPGQYDSNTTEIGYLSGAALFVRSEILHQVGGLDEGYFMYLEDVDWCIRIRESGWKLGYVPSVEVLHYAGGSFNAEKYRYSYRAANPESFKSIMRYFYTYFGAIDRFIVRCVIILSLGTQLLGAIFMSFGKDRNHTYNFIKSTINNIRIVCSSRSPEK